jgi:hypothetical protein
MNSGGKTVQEKAAAKLVVVAAGAVLVVAAVMPSTGIRPYGEGTILAQIAQEDTALCGKFGFIVDTAKHSDCRHDLADLRQRHVQLLAANSWL